MTQVELRQAKEQLLELIARASGGEEIIIVQNGRPLVRLTPVAAAPSRRQFGSARGQIRIGEAFDAPLADFDDYI